ncbi:MAG: glycosyltransferase family 2 protein [Fimbriimonadaceae bacterium]|nr:glycosyltransferase family 2 protein [Fimbriimonadaceae bacterium]
MGPALLDLTIGIVAYNAAAKLRACLASLAAQRGLSSEVVVVDNASTEPVARLVRREFPAVRLVRSAVNLGFARGTNRALAGARGEYLLLLNPDTVLPTPDTLAQLLERFRVTPGCGALGCRLELPDGRTQPHDGRCPRALPLLADLLHWPRPTPPPAAVEYVCGACLLTSRAIWRAIGGLDPGYFMYAEDVDWCCRLRAAGWTCAIASDLTVQHHEGASYGDRQFLRREHSLRSLLRLVRRWDGPLAAAALRLGLLLSAPPKWAAAWASSSPARRQWHAAQWRMGWWGR